MKFTPNTVYTFKLTSGEELIAKVLHDMDDNGYVTIMEPVAVAPGPQGMGLIPSLFTVDQSTELKINTKNVLMCAATASQITDKYIEATTGIKVPSKQILVG